MCKTILINVNVSPLHNATYKSLQCKVPHGGFNQSLSYFEWCIIRDETTLLH